MKTTIEILWRGVYQTYTDGIAGVQQVFHRDGVAKIIMASGKQLLYENCPMRIEYTYSS